MLLHVFTFSNMTIFDKTEEDLFHAKHRFHLSNNIQTKNLLFYQPALRELSRFYCLILIFRVQFQFRQKFIGLTILKGSWKYHEGSTNRLRTHWQTVGKMCILHNLICRDPGASTVASVYPNWSISIWWHTQFSLNGPPYIHCRFT